MRDKYPYTITQIEEYRKAFNGENTPKIIKEIGFMDAEVLMDLLSTYDTGDTLSKAKEQDPNMDVTELVSIMQKITKYRSMVSPELYSIFGSWIKQDLEK